jgi:glycosyltransferase involved in cell wall biosynthesis
VKSALNQALQNIEVIVVVDGPDPATLETLGRIKDHRLQVIALSRNLGGGHARNEGVNRARGTWVAFLDDDDEWFPQKLKIQLNTAKQSRYRYPIVSCRLIGRSETGDFIWPRKLPVPNEHLSEYLFCRKGIFWGDGLVQTSTIFTRRELLKKIGFNTHLSDHGDTEWVLQASALEGACVEFVSEFDPLAIWHIEKNRKRVSHSTNWRNSLAWIQSIRNWVTPRAYASFVMTWISTFAAQKKVWRAVLPLLREAFRHGHPSVIDVLVFWGNWLLPQKLQQIISANLRFSRHERY